MTKERVTEPEDRNNRNYPVWTIKTILNDRCQEHVRLYKRSIIHVIQVLDGKEKSGRPKKVLKEIMAANFANLAKDINLHTQEADWTPE